MKIIKSIGAVIAGFLTVAVLSVATDAALQAAGVFPPQTAVAYGTGLLAIALAYRSLYTIAGGYVTGRLAPSRPMRHVIALMILGGLGGIAGAIAGWNLSAHWYPVSLAVTGPLFVWIGGAIAVRTRKLPAVPAAAKPNPPL